MKGRKWIYANQDFIDSNSQSLKTYRLDHNLNVAICDICFDILTVANSQGTDLTMKSIYSWTMEYENCRELPDSLKSDALKNADLVQIVNIKLQMVRNTQRDRFFPTILVNPELKDKFTRDLEQDQDTVKRTLYDVPIDKDRKNIILKLFAGCLDASKSLRKEYVAECNLDGTPKRLELITPEMRQDYFNGMLEKIVSDPVYKIGVEVAPVWELRVIGEHNKKMYLGGSSI